MQHHFLNISLIIEYRFPGFLDLEKAHVIILYAGSLFFFTPAGKPQNLNDLLLLISRYRNMAGILQIRRKTQDNQSIIDSQSL